MGLEDSLRDEIATAQKEPTNPFALKLSDFWPFGIGFWKYSLRSTKQAKIMCEQAEEYEFSDLINSTILCAYSVGTVIFAARGIHLLYDWLK